MKIVYIAHPISGAVKSNVSRIERILEWIFENQKKVFPIAPYLHACEYLNDSDTRAREIGLTFDKRCIESGIVDELWVCGALSDGVRKEIQWATEKGIDVIFKKDFFEKLI